MWKVTKFAIAGGVGFTIDFLFTWLFREQIGLNQYAANGIGFSMAVLNNFYLNKFWTFNNKSSVSLQFGYFIFFSLVGLALNTFLLFCFVHYCKLNFYLSKCLAIGLVFIWNFLVNNFITFKDQ
ncbi:GtrA family protein [Olivibacter jilunii]|uniref:GtrA family protein n=1 Tax=Olivibacter jilunii TaxID=985016 RepID=UPI003F16911B